jgi:hypothetical protein
MAITATLGASAEGYATSLTQALTITDASNQTLVVGFYWDEAATYDGTVTYNGQALTQISETTGTSQYLWVGYLLNPPTGASYNIVVSKSPAFPERSCGLIAVIVNDNDQTTPYDAAGTPYENVSTTATTKTTSSATGDLVLSFGFCNNKDIGDMEPMTGTGQTLIGNIGSTGAGYLGASYTAGGASITTGWKRWSDAAFNGAEIAFNMNVAAAGGAFVPYPLSSRARGGLLVLSGGLQ